MSAFEIWLRERKIATPAHGYSWNRPCRLVPDTADATMMKPEWIVWPGMKTISLFHFKRLTLEPPVLFEHLSGVGLMAFLDYCDFKVIADGRTTIHEDLRYIHGRSEAMKGNPQVSAVVLAKIEPAEDFNEIRFRTQIPDIYRELLAQMTGAPTVPEQKT